MFELAHYQERDDAFWKTIENLPMTRQEMLLHFPTFFRRREMVRFLAHYELFKQIIDLPGSVVECGVFRGGSFFTWAKLMETFCAADRTRKVYGFDWFKGLKQFTDKDGTMTGKVAEISSKFDGSLQSSGEFIETMVNLHNQDNLLPGIERCVLVNGDVMETIPKFLHEHSGLRISLLHLDMDIYAPTKFALEQLYPRVVKGGIVVLDEYAINAWEGESRAVEEYFKETFGEMPVIKKFPFSYQPHGYFIK
jgi:hypothetical protein